MAAKKKKKATTKKAKPGSRTRPADYHHGNLRQALVDATLVLLESGGLEAVTLRATARAAGVSHMAPYNHFADRSALIAAAAAEGFRRLKVAMDARMAEHPPGHPLRLQASGVAYVVFAVEHPALFRLMFGPELADTSSHPELNEVAQGVYRTLLGGLGGVGFGAPGDPALERLAVAPWAMVHGLAMLVVAGQVPGRTAAEAETLAREATYQLFMGMKNSLPEPRP